MISLELITSIDKLKSISDKDYFSNFAYIMQAALIKDDGLYTDLIDKMYEICEKDDEILSDIVERACKARDLILKISKPSQDKPSPLSLGTFIGNILADFLPDKLTDGEYLSLGIVAESFISYSKNWLNKDEYYEIRDMFVPFYLPISVSMLNIDEIMSYVEDNCPKNSNGLYTLTLLKKIGKTLTDSTISLEDIRKAFEEINFDEAW